MNWHTIAADYKATKYKIRDEVRNFSQKCARTMEEL